MTDETRQELVVDNNGEDSFVDDALARMWTDVELAAVMKFYNEVCAEAEANMLKTGRLEGSHYAAMQTVLRRWKDKAGG